MQTLRRTGLERCAHFPTQMRPFPKAEAASGKEQEIYRRCVRTREFLDEHCGASDSRGEDRQRRKRQERKQRFCVLQMSRKILLFFVCNRRMQRSLAFGLHGGNKELSVTTLMSEF